MLQHSFPSDLAVIFLVAVAVVGALGRIGAPPVVGYLVAGVLVGPSGLALVKDTRSVETLAELGVALLLFAIGLEFSRVRLGHIARFVIIGGGLQVILTVCAAATVAGVAGASVGTGVFWGYLTALSSTAIVLRALADREETAAPHGRFIVGVLLFQDLCIVPMMLTLPMLAGQGGGMGDVLVTLAKALATLAGTLLIARRAVPALLDRVARTQTRELFLLSVLSVAMIVAAITARVGLSVALGAFLAGVAIADTDFVHEASNVVAPFRDTFASVFFVSIGMLLDPRVLVDEPLPVAEVFAAIVLGKLAIGTFAAMLMRFPARVAISAGVGLAQVGEFSFVLLESGLALGLVDAAGARVFLGASVLSMIVAPLAMAASPRIAAGARLLRPLERLLGARPPVEEEPSAHLDGHVIVAGLGAGGQFLLQALAAAQVPAVGIDLDPEVVATLRRAGYRVRYGDIASREVLAHVAEAGRARLLVLLLSDAEGGRRAAAAARSAYPALAVMVRAHRLERDGTGFPPGVEVVAEDQETAVEIVERTLRRFGATGAVVRATLAASRAARDDAGRAAVWAPTAVPALSFAPVGVAAGGRLAHETVGGCGLRLATGASIVARLRGDGVVVNPDPATTIEPGDTLFLVGTPDQLGYAIAWAACEED
jgi:CPA2 family monovalent cation:H+ antiporter-2